MSERFAPAADTFTIGERVVHRLGFGAMRITGDGIWGSPRDRDECRRVLHRVLELGIDLIDTADSYGPYISEELIREALYPYPQHLLIATKAGLVRTGPDEWHPVGRPEYLRQQCEMSLRRLGVDRLDLFQLHRIDPQVPAAEQFGLLAQLRDEGKVAEVGLSEVSVQQIEAARAIVPVVTVQNRFNLAERGHKNVLDYCEEEGIGFIPWSPLADGALAESCQAIADASADTGAAPSQVAIAWLLHRSPVMLPIPGTSSIAHLEQNYKAAEVRLSAEQVAALTGAPA